MTTLRTVVLILLSLIAIAAVRAQSTHQLSSPDGRIKVTVTAGDRLKYSVLFSDKPLVQDATLSLRTDSTPNALGHKVKIKNQVARKVDQYIYAPVKLKAARVREVFNELKLEMEGNYAVIFRAYDEGIGYRFETSLPQTEIKILEEDAGFNFAGDYFVYYPQEESFFSHNEREFIRVQLKSISEKAIASLPAVVDVDGIKVAIAEADVEDYPGMWLRGNADRANGVTAVFPPYPLKEELVRDRDLKVTQIANYIALTRGTRTFPWRVLAIAEKDGDLITNQLVYLLSKPSQIEDTSWIRPGTVAWDWWNANNLYNVTFKAGVNTATYKYYIDFASRYGIEYIILDEGWYKLGDVLDVVPEMDVAELTAYARQKNVGIILWVVWKTLDDKLEPALDQFQKWGVKGIKVDFMQRDDQPVMNFYHRILREAAKRKMLVDFHGAIRPAILARTWPNLVSTEGVKGLEHNKWSKEVTPEHNVTLPFTRMLLGPMDYTPGAMRNAQQRSFASIFEQPMSQGTRCHQLAMYVVYESPLQMLADSPSNYLREPEAMEFLALVPTVWDETRILDARIGDYVLVARRNGSEWWVGAMTDWTARELEVDLGFLPAEKFELDAFEDGPNAERVGSDYVRVRKSVERGTKLKVKLAAGGGWAARIRK